MIKLLLNIIFLIKNMAAHEHFCQFFVAIGNGVNNVSVLIKRSAYAGASHTKLHAIHAH